MTQTLVESEHIKKTCKTCINECKDDGGQCAPLTAEEWVHFEDTQIDPILSLEEHCNSAHPATLRDAVIHCPRGHRSEANPVEAMRAAGIPELFDL